MDCHAARAELWPPERPRILGDVEATARAHVSDCPACARYFAQDRSILDALHALRQERAPLEVRERVFRALAEARSGEVSAGPSHRRTQTRMTPWIATGAGLVLVAGSLLAALGNQLRSGTADTRGVVVDDYLRRAVGEEYLDTSDPRAVTHFLERELGTVLSPLEMDGLTVERVEICLLDGIRGAMIQYRMNGERVSHYIVPTTTARRRAPAVAQDRPGSAGETLPVVTWAVPAIEQALVGAVSSAELLALARVASTR